MNNAKLAEEWELLYLKVSRERDALRAALEAMVDMAQSPDFDGAPSDAVLTQALTALGKVSP